MRHDHYLRPNALGHPLYGEVHRSVGGAARHFPFAPGNNRSCWNEISISSVCCVIRLLALTSKVCIRCMLRRLVLNTSFQMHIRLATLADCSETASISVTSFHDDELFDWMNPRRVEFPDDFRYFFLRRHQMRFWSPDHVFYVAMTDEQDNDWSGKSQIVGYAVWERRGDTEAAKSWKKTSLRGRKYI